MPHSGLHVPARPATRTPQRPQDPTEPAASLLLQRAVDAHHRRHGVTATPNGLTPTGMSSGCLVRVFTSIVDTVPLPVLVTKAVLPWGVKATAYALAPTVVSVGRLTRVFTSIVLTVTEQVGAEG